MHEVITISTLFAIISILFAIEASTSLARIAGLNTGSLAGGLQLQSGLSLFSRALMAIFMPALGGLADSGYFNSENMIIVFFSTALIPLFIWITVAWRNQLLSIYHNSVSNILIKGSYFPIKFKENKSKKYKKRSGKIVQLRPFKVITILAYMPYYLTWPIVVLFLSIAPDDRGFIIGLSSIMNGITTLALVLYIDPLLIKFSRYKYVSVNIYYEQLMIRLLASLLSSLPFVACGVYLLFTD